MLSTSGASVSFARAQPIERRGSSTSELDHTAEMLSPHCSTASIAVLSTGPLLLLSTL